MDRGAWWAAVHGVAKSQARLSDEHSRSQLGTRLGWANRRRKIFVGSPFTIVLVLIQLWSQKEYCCGRNRESKMAYLRVSNIEGFVSFGFTFSPRSVSEGSVLLCGGSNSVTSSERLPMTDSSLTLIVDLF